VTLVEIPQRPRLIERQGDLVQRQQFVEDLFVMLAETIGGDFSPIRPSGKFHRVASRTRRTVPRWRKCGWAMTSCSVRTGAQGTRSASSAATAASRLGKPPSQPSMMVLSDRSQASRLCA